MISTRNKELFLKIEKKKQFFSDLFTAPFPGHGVRVNIRPTEDTRRFEKDILSKDSIEDRAQLAVKKFKNDCRMLEIVDDDRVPCLHLWSGTAIKELENYTRGDKCQNLFYIYVGVYK